jgi:hypothetical protein
MVELEDRNRSIEIERDVLELHCFLVGCARAMGNAAGQIGCLGPYLIFEAGLSMVEQEHLVFRMHD